MGNKYFAISDVHSFYKPMKKALDMAGYDKDDPSHVLIILGDVFDRGPDTMDVYRFLRSIPEDRLILVRGNHEDCYEELLEKEIYDAYDENNGTVDTFEDIYRFGKGDPLDADWKDVVDYVKGHEITEWVKSGRWRPFFEIGDFILTHSFIPLHNKGKDGIFRQYYRGYELEYFPEWRTKATKTELWESRWGCPWKQFKASYFKEEGKTLVCGHWHTSDFHEEFEGRKGDYTIYRGKNLIAIDGCTALTNRANVLVIDGDRLSDQYGRDLDNLVYEGPKPGSYFIPAYSAWDGEDAAWCHGDCKNRLCLRNLNFVEPQSRYVTVAELTGVCGDYSEKGK